MSLIECLVGPTTTPVGQETYTFKFDEHGRAVCHVANLRHRAILLGLTAYRETTDIPAILPPVDELGDGGLAVELGEAKRQIAERDTQLSNLAAELATATSQLEGARSDLNKAHLDLNELQEKLTAAEQEIRTLNELFEEHGTSPGAIAENLSTISGLGDASQEKLATKGITNFSQLSALTAEQMAALDKELQLGGASARNDWIGQAKAIVAERAKTQA